MGLDYTEKSKILYFEELVAKTATTTLFSKSGLDGFHPDHFISMHGFLTIYPIRKR